MVVALCALILAFKHVGFISILQLKEFPCVTIGRFQNHCCHLDVSLDCFERLVQLAKVILEIPVVVHELFTCGRDVLLALTILA